jgi:hypothetical protein
LFLGFLARVGEVSRPDPVTNGSTDGDGPDPLFGSFDQVAAALEKRLAEWGCDDEDGQGDDTDAGANSRWPA